jgi:hypothetical protein
VGRGHFGDCPNFCVNKNGTVPFVAVCSKNGTVPFGCVIKAYPDSRRRIPRDTYEKSPLRVPTEGWSGRGGGPYYFSGHALIGRAPSPSRPIIPVPDVNGIMSDLHLEFHISHPSHPSPFSYSSHSGLRTSHSVLNPLTAIPLSQILLLFRPFHTLHTLLHPHSSLRDIQPTPICVE